LGNITRNGFARYMRNLPALDSAADAVQRNSWERAYQYMGLNLTASHY
jgi:hypothetical protein